MKLYVLRHGETDINVKHLINGRNNITINKNGILQAKEAALKLKNIKIDYIFCSPLQRTKDTCKYVNIYNIPIIYDDRLMERDSKSMQYKSDTSYDINEWYDINKDIIYNDAEGFKSILNRAEDFLNFIKQKYHNKNILLITHGDVCKALYLLITKDLNNYKNEFANCEIVEYQV